MLVEKNINILMFRKLFIALLCIGTIYLSFAMVTTGDEKTGEETIQITVPSTARMEDIKSPVENKGKDVSTLEKTTIKLTNGTREITPESRDEPGDGTPADRQVQVMTKYMKRNEFHVSTS